MCSALALAAAYALAGPFDWNAPAECPTAATVRAEIERHLGRSLDDLSLASWSVAGTITRDAEGGWSLALAIETPDGRTERTLHDPHACEAVSEAAALLVALALDPEAVAATADEPRPTTDTEQTEPAAMFEPEVERDETIAAATPDVPPPTTPSLPLLFVIRTTGGFDWGTLRGVSPIGRGAFAWQLPKMRVGIAAQFGVTPGFTVPAVTRDISLWMWTVSAEAGPVLRRGKLEFPLLVGIEAGQITVRPRVLLAPTRRQVTWAALLLQPGLAWVPRRWFALVADVGVMISFVRPEFAIQGIDPPIHRPLPAGIRATAGVEFRIELPVAAGGGGE